MSKALSFGSNSRPGMVAKERSSGENSVSAAILFLFSSLKIVLYFKSVKSFPCHSPFLFLLWLSSTLCTARMMWWFV